MMPPTLARTGFGWVGTEGSQNQAWRWWGPDAPQPFLRAPPRPWPLDGSVPTQVRAPPFTRHCRSAVALALACANHCSQMCKIFQASSLWETNFRT